MSVSLKTPLQSWMEFYWLNTSNLFFANEVDIGNRAVEGNAAQCKGKGAAVMCMKFPLTSSQEYSITSLQVTCFSSDYSSGVLRQLFW